MSFFFIVVFELEPLSFKVPEPRDRFFLYTPRKLAHDNNISSVHVNFCAEDEVCVCVSLCAVCVCVTIVHFPLVLPLSIVGEILLHG